ncbi:MAG: tRNA epoxyqueuosine(34) reductase QueG [Burkholderiaceae bacterium]
MRQWGHELGFSQIGIAPVDLSSAEPGLLAWLQAGFHGQMDYMARHGLKRARPAELVPGTLSVITARMDYLPRAGGDSDPAAWLDREWQRLQRPGEAVVSVYARGRDYHRVLRQRLAQLAERIAQHAPALVARAFTDSAPVLEAELAVRSGLGWRGKHTLVLSREAGSMFFLGEIFVNLALPADEPVPAHCGSCEACITACPTQAIVAPHRLDARRCISYLTIEHDGPIPEALRAPMGNRIYGCDDCQLACPWNKFAQRSPLPDFDERDGLAGSAIAQLLAWDEAEFLRRTEGSAIRRIGHARWQRNLCVAAGNALASAGLPPDDVHALRTALQPLRQSSDAVLAEHAQWAWAQG